MTDNQNPNEPDTGLAEQYQSILDKYSQELAVPAPPAPAEILPPPPVNPEPVEGPPIPPLPPTFTSSPTPTIPQPTNPEPARPEPVEAVEEPPISPQTSMSSPVSPSPLNSFFKFIFFLSLLVFLAVLAGNIYVFFLAKPDNSSADQPTLIPNPTANVVDYCSFNEVRYVIDQTFPAQDDCNTCTCLADLTISCTNNICPTAGPTKKPLSLAVSSVYPTSGLNTDSVTLYGTGFSLTNNSIVFAPANIKTNSCSFTFTNQPSADGQKISLALTGFSEVTCTQNVATTTPTPKPTLLVAGVYDVSVKVASASSYTKTKLIKFTIK